MSHECASKKKKNAKRGRERRYPNEALVSKIKKPSSFGPYHHLINRKCLCGRQSALLTQ